MEEPKTKKRVVYSTDIFDVPSIDAAKRLILSSGAGTTSEERWERETPYVVAEIGSTLAIDETACVIDYGCGIGRIAKGLIERYGCSVVGVDISSSMRKLALEYVTSDRFTAVSPVMLDTLVARGFRATNAFSCWVLQHCARPADDIERIHAALMPGGTTFVLNTHRRWVPTDHGMVDDRVSVEALLASRFETVSRYDMPPDATIPDIASAAFVMIVRKRN